MNKIKELIQEDLLSLYEKNYIERAKYLNNQISGFNVCENMVPGFFTGDLKAQTVLVMLNPGGENKTFSYESECKKKYNSFNHFLDKYIECQENYGEHDFSRMDNFDLKQVPFLYSFKDSGIEIQNNWFANNNFINDEVKYFAKRNVLLNKLQLELVPYPSKTFTGKFDTFSSAKKYIFAINNEIIKLLDMITESERKYVVFCSKQFYWIFKALEMKNDNIITIRNGVVSKIKIGKMNYSFSKLNINYRGKTINAGIAHTFASRALPNATDKMLQYGKFCHDEYVKM